MAQSLSYNVDRFLPPLPVEILRAILHHLYVAFLASDGADTSMFSAMKFSRSWQTAAMEIFFDEKSDRWSCNEWTVKARVIKRVQEIREMREVFVATGKDSLVGKGRSRREMWRKLYGRSD